MSIRKSIEPEFFNESSLEPGFHSLIPERPVPGCLRSSHPVQIPMLYRRSLSGVKERLGVSDLSLLEPMAVVGGRVSD